MVQYHRFEGEERQVEILGFTVNGFPMLDKVGAADFARMTEYCRKVTDYQFQQLPIGPRLRRRRATGVFLAHARL